MTRGGTCSTTQQSALAIAAPAPTSILGSVSTVTTALVTSARPVTPTHPQNALAASQGHPSTLSQSHVPVLMVSMRLGRRLVMPVPADAPIAHLRVGSAWRVTHH